MADWDSFGIVSLDEAFICYEASKRQVADAPQYYYDTLTNKFERIKSTMPRWIEEPRISASGIVFINSYKLCLKLIGEYLNLPSNAEYKASFERKSGDSRNVIVDFLWFFEHIDGCVGFENFEAPRVEVELKKWCALNGLEYRDRECTSAGESTSSKYIK